MTVVPEWFAGMRGLQCFARLVETGVVDPDKHSFDINKADMFDLVTIYKFCKMQRDRGGEPFVGLETALASKLTQE